jgi:hypothetical protein
MFDKLLARISILLVWRFLLLLVPGGALGTTALAAPGPGQLLLSISDPDPSMGYINDFATAVATLGNEAVISAPNNTTNGNGAGLVYLYNMSSGSLQLTLHNPAPTGEVTEFGSALATIGNNIVVGTPRAQDSVSNFNGYGAVYQFSGITGALLTTSGGSAQFPSATGFGTAVAVDGPNLLIGDPGYDPTHNSANYGAVYIAGSASGALSGTVSRTSPVGGEDVGTSVAAGNGYLLAGAPTNSTYATNAGAAYLFSDSTHAQLLALASGDPRESEQFGHAVAISGSDLFVGAPNVGSTGPDYSGAVYEFNAATGSLLHTFRNPTTGGYDWFGYSLTAVGDDLLIGAPADNSAFLYDITTGDLIDTFVDPGPSTSVGFGYSAAGFSNGDFLIGAPGLGGNNDIGAAYVFNAVPEPGALALAISAAVCGLVSRRFSRRKA